MPRGDRTGPEGNGPMTGRQMGYCAGNEYPGSANLNPGYGRRFGRGFNRLFGRGRGLGFGRDYGNYSDENIPNVSTKNVLENEIRNLKERLSIFEKQLSKTKEND